MSTDRRLSGSFELNIDADRAFPLFTALGEKLWVPGWNPEMVVPESGQLEQDQVFLTGEGAEQTLWYVSQLSLEQRDVHYIRVTPGSRVARVHVCVTPTSSGCRVDVTYVWTVLGPGGGEIVREAAEQYEDMMGQWKSLVEASCPDGVDPLV